MSLLTADHELVFCEVLSILISVSVPKSLTVLSNVESSSAPALADSRGIFLFNFLEALGGCLQHPVNTELDTADKGS